MISIYTQARLVAMTTHHRSMFNVRRFDQDVLSYFACNEFILFNFTVKIRGKHGQKITLYVRHILHIYKVRETQNISKPT